MELKVIYLLMRLLTLTFCGSYVQGDAYFTKSPNVVYVDSAGNRTAEFIWDYHVDKRDQEFGSLSPRWSFFNESNEEVLIVEDKFAPIKWDWKIATNCPARFRDRVSKKSNATLVISNVTEADNGMYGCTLAVSTEITDKAELIFTVPPQINVTGETKVMVNTNLTLICSAVGPPKPNVTWINQTSGKVLSQGIESVTLKIMNIPKEQNGANYSCNATNNPTTSPTTAVKTVTVLYPPKFISYAGVTKVAAGCSCDEIEIECPLAEGSPPPTYYLYSPSNETIEAMKTGVGKTFKVKPQSGNWTCRATNGIGKDIYHKVAGKVLPDKVCKICDRISNGDFSAGEIAAIVLGVLAGVAIIAVIAVVIYKKKKSDEDFSAGEIAAIVLGVLAGVAIIAVIAVVIYKKKKNSDEGLSAGEIAAIVLGVLAGVAIIAVIAVVIYKKKKNSG